MASDVARFAECRALGHMWAHIGRPLTTEELGFKEPLGIEWGSVAFRSTCGHCGTTRTKWIGRSGTLYPARYTYPDGYERRGEEERMTQGDWRKAWVVNVLGE
jgi:hypothetical protein